MRRLRIQIPAVIVEFRLVRHHLHADRRPLLHPQKPDHHVRHLHARVINIVLNLHAIPRVSQNPHHRVAQHRVPHVPDVRRLVRIDARMLYNDLVGQPILAVRFLFRSLALALSAPPLRVLSVSTLSFLVLFLPLATRRSPLPTFFPSHTLPKLSPVEIRIQVPPARNLHPRDPLDPPQTIRNLLRNQPRRLLQPLRQFKTHRGSRLTHLNLRRPLQHNRQLHAIFLADVSRQRLPQPLRQCLIHVPSSELEWSPRIQPV